MTSKAKVVQFRATPKAQSKISELKSRLKSKGVKPSIEIVLNALLENITLAEFDKCTKQIIADNSVKTQLLEMFKEGRITEEMLEILMKNAEQSADN
ncbi:hypothetical protein AB204_11555 [Xenorhabdus khoisanae]|uniref:Uncharacterized protein n=1 Tax=Xenorhabdus khoisanae TaxID=880157 RepID=A0A0J5FRR4_9GAMM|nr:hypothetical protein [Xenorhabdus khoisanae]KMJ44973.1 hypothetical protein AB204_11555 [Xenorhabdus khoisanae]